MDLTNIPTQISIFYIFKDLADRLWTSEVRSNGHLLRRLVP